MHVFCSNKFKFLANIIERQLGRNKIPFLADLVLYELVADTNLKLSVKIEK